VQAATDAVPRDSGNMMMIMMVMSWVDYCDDGGDGLCFVACVQASVVPADLEGWVKGMSKRVSKEELQKRERKLRGRGGCCVS
jgi:hypothetical protein